MHLQGICISICETGFYMLFTYVFWDHSEKFDLIFSGGRKVARRKLSQRNLSKFMDNKKISLSDIPTKTMRVTIHALRWVFLLIFIFMTIGIFALFLTGGENHVQNILGYSITGFFTFFMGYFGWILAQGVIEVLSGKHQETMNEFSYYMRKDSKRYRF